MADLISVRDGASNHHPNLEQKIHSLEEEVKVLRMELEAMAWAVTVKEAERAAMEAEVRKARQMAAEIDEYKRGMVSEMEDLKRKLEVSMEAEERMAREISFIESEALHDAMDSRSIIESLRTDIRYKEICLAAAAAAALDQLQVLAPSPNNQASNYITMNSPLPQSSILVPWQANMKASQINESQGPDLGMATIQGPELAMAPPSIHNQPSIDHRNTTTTNPSAAPSLKSSQNIPDLAPALAPAHEAKQDSKETSVLPSETDSSSSSSSKLHGSAPILTSIANSRVGTPSYNYKSIGSGLGSGSRYDQSDHQRRRQLLEQASKTLNDRQAGGASGVAKSPSINSLLRKFSSSSKKPATNWWSWSRPAASHLPTMSPAQDISSPLIYSHA